MVAGILAGLGVAMPLGAIGALLLREGLVNGFRVAAASAAGVAAVDVVYCAVATVTGAMFARMIEEHRGVFLVASGSLIIGIGAKQLREGLARRDRPVAEVEPSSVVRAFVRFVGLTAINPMTLIYFIALGGAVSAADRSWVGPALFVAAVGLSSLAWQLVLAGAGSLLGGALDPRVAHTIGIAAACVILVLGAVVAVNGAGVVARPVT